VTSLMGQFRKSQDYSITSSARASTLGNGERLAHTIAVRRPFRFRITGVTMTELRCKCCHRNSGMRM